MPLRIYPAIRYQQLYIELLEQHIEEVNLFREIPATKFKKESFRDSNFYEEFLEKKKKLIKSFTTLDHGIPEQDAFEEIAAFDRKRINKIISYDLFQQLVTQMKDSSKFDNGFDQQVYELGFRMYVGCADSQFDHSKYGIIVVPSLCNKDPKKPGREKSAFKNVFFAINADNTELNHSSSDCSRKIAEYDDISNVKAVLFTLNDLDNFVKGIENMPKDPKKAAIQLFFAREADNRLTLVLRFRGVKADGRLGDILESDSATGLVFDFNKGDLIPPPPDDGSNQVDDTSF